MTAPLDFAGTEKAARERYAESNKRDPFPEIEPALLSAADIYDYTLKVGMVYPFDKTYLKPATYALTIGGPYVSWQDGKKTEGILKKGQYLTLKKDSILFVTLEPLIQLPHYIAARFNLTIDHVYRGLLLGTGPLVDPGFVGRLSIPLHNFTSNDYQLKGGEKFIWMEFTKLSANRAWSWGEGKSEKNWTPVVFPDKKKDRRLDDYIYEADKRPIESSIPLSVIKSEKSAKDAEQSVKSAENFVRIVVGINLAAILAVVALVWNVYIQSKSLYKDTRSELLIFQQERLRQDSVKFIQLEREIESLKESKRQVGKINKEINEWPAKT
jgi:deoxycytidine triphosphate deaminase